jgi:hypothetical protein
MKNDLEEIKGGASDGSKVMDDEMKHHSLKSYPVACSYLYQVNADGEEEENGEFIHWCHYYDFKARMRVRFEPKAVILSVHIGDDTLVEQEISNEALSTLEKYWPIAAENIKRWIEASAEFKEKRERAE